jgi:hypothetical protein
MLIMGEKQNIGGRNFKMGTGEREEGAVAKRL